MNWYRVALLLVALVLFAVNGRAAAVSTFIVYEVAIGRSATMWIGGQPRYDEGRAAAVGGITEAKFAEPLPASNRSTFEAAYKGGDAHTIATKKNSASRGRGGSTEREI
jgi:hypothetical protein